MKDTLMKLKEVHSSSVLIILCGSSIRVYDEDANIVEYVSHVIGKEDVILHLPLPHIDNFLPILIFFSIKITLFPFDDALEAAIIPAGPAPITTTVFSILFSTFL